MIRQENSVFILDTNETTYCFLVMPSGHLEHLYYGNKVEISADVSAVSEKNRYIAGNLIAYSEEFPQLGLEDICLELSTYGKGDIREPFVEIQYADGSQTSDFLFESAVISKGKAPFDQLPGSYDKHNTVDHLEIQLIDKVAQVRLYLHYWVYEECNVITRTAKVVNMSGEPCVLNRLMSTQVDFDHNEFQFSNFCGAWAREMNRYDHPCHQGKIVNSSMTGTSSNRNNPFVMLSGYDTTETAGDCYGFNLIYSGNHYEAVEVNSFGKLRFVSGINPATFSCRIRPNETFETPEAVMTYSSKGYQGMSQNMHMFVREHIVRGEWKYKERPILLNSWEAAYFDISESKLVSMAKVAKEVGIELFVMDDGWFGERSDDTSSLGDWYPNKKKFPNGLEGIANKINELGLDFGIWLEPEMVSENSECYRAHPEWAVHIPGREHSKGRNQFLLDLTRKEVREYLLNQLTAVLSSGNISYVKWDMNRIVSDAYSCCIPTESQNEFSHRYVLGLYEILDALTARFPHVLFEGCSSGGNRFDLGMLCYMPQIWASDNTDALCRAKIQTGYSYGYPMSTISAHISSCPNHQTLRSTPIETRFNVASFGILGYECNLKELKKEELDAVIEQIKLYKQYRMVFQYGDYYRIKNGETTDFTHRQYQWIVVSKDQTKAIAFFLQDLVTPNIGYAKLVTKGLDNQKLYRFCNRVLKYNVKEFGDLINIVSPIHIKKDSIAHNVISKIVKLDGEREDYTATGSMLNHMGVKLKQGYISTGYDDQVRHFPDFASRIYLIEETMG